MILTFSEALESLKQKNKVARLEWVAKYLIYYSPIANATVDFTVEGEEYVLQPFILLKTEHGTVVTYIPTQSDILQDDWVIINDVHIA